MMHSRVLLCLFCVRVPYEWSNLKINLDVVIVALVVGDGNIEFLTIANP